MYGEFLICPDRGSFRSRGGTAGKVTSGCFPEMEVCPDELSGDTEPEVAMEYGDTRQGTSQSSLAKQHVSAPQSGSDSDMTACRAWYGIATEEFALE